MTGELGKFSESKRHRIKLITPRQIYLKYTFLYTLLYIISFFAGCALFHAIDLGESSLVNSRIIAFFSRSSIVVGSPYEFAGSLISQSKNDLVGLTIVLTAGFTMFVVFALSLYMLTRGIAYGFSTSYLVYAIRLDSVDLPQPILSALLFSLLGAINASLFIHLCVKTTVFSGDFKSLCGRPSLIIRSKSLYSQLARFLIAIGAVLIVNLIRFII